MCWCLCERVLGLCALDRRVRLCTEELFLGTCSGHSTARHCVTGLVACAAGGAWVLLGFGAVLWQ